MKAITILQPWASLIACGAKQIETRSWATKYRGEIAIHAGLSSKFVDTVDWNKKVFSDPFLTALKPYHFYRNDGSLSGMKLEYGKVIAIADLVDCVEMTASRIAMWKKVYGDNEIIFGDFQLGRYAWILANVRAVEPVPAKGMQRLWEWEP